MNAREEAVGFYRRWDYRIYCELPRLFSVIRQFEMRKTLAG
ncbi:MAG: hypothetical protein ACRD1C_11340 [Terriglobales bacterium]